jgi:hypothetical protein
MNRGFHKKKKICKIKHHSSQIGNFKLKNENRNKKDEQNRTEDHKIRKIW